VIIPNVKPGRRHRIDFWGVLLASAGLLAICYGLVEGQKYDWGTISGFISIPLVLGVGVALLIAFLVVQKLTQDKEPLVPFAVFRDRNYSVVNWVSGVLAVGMMGIFLPLTIYLQSVLGFSALKAGLVIAPASLVSMFVAPVAGRSTDKIGGKFILMSGLTLFAVGIGWLALIARPNSSWPVFMAPLIVTGLGMGCIFAPMVTVAMRNIPPQLAGAASGVLNTVRQVGLVIGTATVGALLQNRLVSSIASQASTKSAALPPQVRGRFVSEINKSAQSGIQVGAGQTGGSTRAGPGVPAQVVAEITRIGHDVFTSAFVTAMKQTMILPVILLAIGALSCLAIKEGKRTPPAPAEPGVARAEQATPAA
jgi:MFS family permease